MRFTAKYAVWLLLPLVAGCDHKVQPTQQQTLAPPIVDAPPPKPVTVSKADLPPPVIGDAPAAKPTQEATAETPVKKPVHHPKKPITPPTAPVTAPAVPAATTTADATPPPSVSAVGELSGGASGNAHSQTEDLINATEKGVNAITRPLSDPETKTAAHIREFLKQAREALTTGDTDGANTLAMKAKVLLAELNQ